MKKVITLFLLLACYFVSIAQVVDNPVYFKKYIKVKDSIQSTIYRQGGDTLATKKYVRENSGAGANKENTLPTPASNGLFLTSTTSNVRSWAALSTPSQLKNYNPNQDTVIRFPNLASGKFGIWQNTNSGIQHYLNTNNASSYQNYITTNNGVQNYLSTNGGYQNYTEINNAYQNHISTNNGFQNVIGTNNAIQNYIVTNAANKRQNVIVTNNGIQTEIETNNGTGIRILNTNGSARRGILSHSADTVSITSGAKTAVFGKLAGTNPAQMTFDGFGQMRMVRNGVTKMKIDTSGLIYASAPHIHKIDTSSNFQISLVQGVFKKVSNATNDFWSNNADAYYFTFSADTLINTLKGHYTLQYQLDVESVDQATYIYRIREKQVNGTVSTIQKFEVRGTGTKNHRIIECDTKCNSVGCKYWVEVQWAAGGNGTPITITGGSLFVRTVHLLVN